MALETSANSNSKCTECGGEEWIETKDGWKRCVCLEKKIKTARTKRLVENCGLNGALLTKSFDNYLPKNKEQKVALEKIRSGGSFFIIGPFGTGKTHLLAASVNDAVSKEVNVLFFSVPWLLKRIREDMFSGKPMDVLDTVCGVEYLALDDLGKEKPSDSVQEKLFMIIDRRDIEGLRTSVTSNLDPDTLSDERLDGAIISRLRGMCEVIVLEGEDFRINKGRR